MGAYKRRIDILVKNAKMSITNKRFVLRNKKLFTHSAATSPD